MFTEEQIPETGRSSSQPLEPRDGTRSLPMIRILVFILFIAWFLIGAVPPTDTALWILLGLTAGWSLAHLLLRFGDSLLTHLQATVSMVLVWSCGLLWVAYLLASVIINVRVQNIPSGGLPEYLAVFEQLRQSIAGSSSVSAGIPNQFALDRIGQFPSLLLFLPIYSLFRSAEALYIPYFLLLVSAVVPIFLLARAELRSDGQAYAIAAAYLLSPALGVLLPMLFHPAAVALLALAWWFYFQKINSTKGARWALGFILLTGPGFAIVMLSISVLQLVRHYRTLSSRRETLVTLTVCVVAIYVYQSVVNAFLISTGESSTMGIQLSRLIPVEPVFQKLPAIASYFASPETFVRHVFDDLSLQITNYLIVPLLGLSVFSDLSLLLFAEAIVGGERRSAGTTQYFFLLPAVFCALPSVLARGRWRSLLARVEIPGQPAICAVLTAIVLMAFVWMKSFGEMSSAYPFETCRAAGCSFYRGREQPPEIPAALAAKVSGAVVPNELLILPESWIPMFPRQMVKLDLKRAADWLEKIHFGDPGSFSFFVVDAGEYITGDERTALTKIQSYYALSCIEAAQNVAICRGETRR